MRICLVEGCERPWYCRDWCKLHYERWKHRKGDPAISLQGKTPRHRPGPSDRVFTYGAVHHRLRRDRGKAGDYTCPCGEQARDWAFDEPVGFSEDQDRYMALCRSCHLRKDGKACVSA